MKSCPTCGRTYTDASLNFCLEDGTPLTVSAPGGATPEFDPHATIRYTDPRDTKSPPAEPPPVSPPAYQAAQPQPVTPQVSQPIPQPPLMPAPPPSIPPAPPTPRKSNAVWWILGGLVVLGIITAAVIIVILALASMGSNSNINSNRANKNSPNRNANVNANANNSNTSTNTNANLPAILTDDFSQKKWGTGNYAFGDIWYADDQYHMRSKPKTYLVMYAPDTTYDTKDATVSVTARSVDGTPAASGFGLIVHGEKSKSGQLEDYALLIYNGDEPKYEIIKHKGGVQSEVVPWVSSKVIRKGTNTNQLEVRTKGSELSFYINGQYVDRITDTENFKGGIAGLYTSDSVDIAFDDLEIRR
jgi:outer membrane biosynthesis protein TonB